MPSALTLMGTCTAAVAHAGHGSILHHDALAILAIAIDTVNTVLQHSHHDKATFSILQVSAALA